jgi:hypothetical protein
MGDAAPSFMDTMEGSVAIGVSITCGFLIITLVVGISYIRIRWHKRDKAVSRKAGVSKAATSEQDSGDDEEESEEESIVVEIPEETIQEGSCLIVMDTPLCISSPSPHNDEDISDTSSCNTHTQPGVTNEDPNTSPQYRRPPRRLVEDTDMSLADNHQFPVEADGLSSFIPTISRRAATRGHDRSIPTPDVPCNSTLHASQPPITCINGPAVQPGTANNGTVPEEASPTEPNGRSFETGGLIPININNTDTASSGRTLRRRLVDDIDLEQPQIGHLPVEVSGINVSYDPTRPRRQLRVGHEDVLPEEVPAYGTSQPTPLVDTPFEGWKTVESTSKGGPSTPPADEAHSSNNDKGMSSADRRFRRRLVDETDVCSSGLHVSHFPIDTGEDMSSFSPSRTRQQTTAGHINDTKTGAVIVDSGVMYFEDLLEISPVTPRGGLQPHEMQHAIDPLDSYDDPVMDECQGGCTTIDDTGAVPTLEEQEHEEGVVPHDEDVFPVHNGVARLFPPVRIRKR